MEKETMKAAVKTAEGEFEIKNVPAPLLTDPDWVVAAVAASGICGTDLRHWKKHEPELECKIMGHELSGTITEVGANVKHLKIGDRVVIETLLGDQTCEWCRVQKYNLCPHLYPIRMETLSQAFAAFVSGPAKKFYKLPENISFEEATLLDTFAVGMHALQLSRIKLNDWAVIIGAGPIGLGLLQLAKLSGARVIIADVIDSSLRIAAELGADVVINTKSADITEEVLKITTYRGADIVFECAGGESMPTTLLQATQVARIGGKVIIVGGFDKGKLGIELDWQRLQMAEIQLISSASYAYWDIYPEMQLCIDLLAQGKLNAKKLITHTYTLDEINTAFETAFDKERTAAVFVALTVKN